MKAYKRVGKLHLPALWDDLDAKYKYPQPKDFDFKEKRRLLTSQMETLIIQLGGSFRKGHYFQRIITLKNFSHLIEKKF